MFAQILLQAISGVVSSELQALLAKFRELNGDEKADQLEEAIRNSFTLLKSVTDKTKTKVDDTVVALVLNVVA